MDLNEIWIFTRVIQTGSFSAAALALEIPKSTVSTKIRRLEERLGVSLITRTTRKLKLTESGVPYFEKCMQALENLQVAESEVTRSQNVPQGRLRVTAPIDLGHILLTPLLDRFISKNPEIQIELLLTDDVIDLVGDGVDVAIRAGPLSDSSLKARRLGENLFRLYASPKYLKRSSTPRSPADLSGHRCLHFSTLSPRGEWDLKRGSEKKQIRVSGPITSNHLVQLKDLAIEGLGIALLPDFLCTDEVKRGQLSVVLPEWHGERSSVYVVYPDQQFMPPKLERFTEFMVREFHLKS
jgi:DNA-binding transcriptional LysR family regulator